LFTYCLLPTAYVIKQRMGELVPTARTFALVGKGPSPNLEFGLWGLEFTP
jgi:hypothetical protein